MGMILCGWCSEPTKDGERCDHCRHIDPTRPYTQRGLPVPDASEAKLRRLARAEADIRAAGEVVTVERLAERLGVDPRTVRRWREVSA